MYGYNNSYPAYQMQANQNRINDLQQQYGMFQPYQMQQAQTQQSQIIKGRPVSSYEEAKASMIDLDGSLFVFPDVANGRIYTKQVMLDGTSDFREYVLVESGRNANSNDVKTNGTEYVLRSDFENTINQLLKQIEMLKGGADNDKWENTGNDKSSNAKQSNV